MTIKAIIKLMDVKTLVAGILPVLLGSVYSAYAFGQFNIYFFILLLIAIILIQSATNMINDYFDFRRGADNKEKEHEKALVSGEVTEKQVLTIIVVYQAIAILIGFFLASQTSYYIMLVAFVGALISVLYAFGRLPISYMPIGEIVSGVTMGIGITSTVIYIQSSTVNLYTILVALPTALFIATVLLSNNLSDLESDKLVGRKTLPILLGTKRTEKLWVFNVLALLIILAIFVILKIFPFTSLIITIILFPYKSISEFLSYEKSIYTKDRTMSLIGKIGLKYHIAIICGLIISLF